MSSNTTIHIVGTNHTSWDSYDDVESVLDNSNPDVVALELDMERYLLQDEGQNVVLINQPSFGDSEMCIRAKLLVALHSLLQNQESEGDTGLDMKAGLKIAEQEGIPVALVDKRIANTFNQLVSRTSVAEYLGILLASSLSCILSVFGLYNQESMDNNTLKRVFPTYYDVVIGERDEYIAESTISATKEKDCAVLVVGRGHLERVENILSNEDGIDVVGMKDAVV